MSGTKKPDAPATNGPDGDAMEWIGPYHAEHSTQPASVRLYAWRCSADRHGADDRDTPDADAHDCVEFAWDGVRDASRHEQDVRARP